MVKLLGITGPSSSGKSTVSRTLQGEKEDVGRFSLDNFYRPYDEFEGENYDHPRAIKFDEACWALRKIKEGNRVTIPKYGKAEEDVVGVKVVKPSPVVLVDGFLLLHHDGIRRMLDRTVFLDVSREEQLRRRKRRVREGELTTGEDYFHEYVYPAYKKYIEPMKEEADHIIDAEKEPEEVVEELRNKVETMFP